MRAVWIGGLILLLAFSALPALLSPRAVTWAQGSGNLVVPICQNCGPDAGYAFFSTCNTSDEPAEIFIEYLEDAQEVGTQRVDVESFQCDFYPVDVPDGFDGTAIFTTSTGVFTIQIQSANPDGSGPTAVTVVDEPPPFQPTYTPLPPGSSAQPLTYTLDVCNASFSPSQFDTFGINPNGRRTSTFLPTLIQVGECGNVDVTELPGTGDGRWGGQTFSAGSVPATTYQRIETGGLTQLTPGQGSAEAGQRICVPSLAVTNTVTVQNLGSSPTNVSVQYRDDGGDVTRGASDVLTPLSSSDWMVSPGESACFEAPAPVLSGIAFYQLEDGSLEIFPLPDEPVAKRAILAGAERSTRRTRINVVLQNLDDRRAKARVIVRDGTGDKIFARTVRAPGNGVGRRRFLPRAQGDDLWVDVRVRGGGNQVFLWLERVDPSGDVTLYPPARIR